MVAWAIRKAGQTVTSSQRQRGPTEGSSLEVSFLTLTCCSACLLSGGAGPGHPGHLLHSQSQPQSHSSAPCLPCALLLYARLPSWQPQGHSPSERPTPSEETQRGNTTKVKGPRQSRSSPRHNSSGYLRAVEQGTHHTLPPRAMWPCGEGRNLQAHGHQTWDSEEPWMGRTSRGDGSRSQTEFFPGMDACCTRMLSLIGRLRD